MINEIMTYYIPNNPNIPKGHIYTLYLNHNTNLDLSSILNLQPLTLNNVIETQNGPLQQTSQITISKDDYTKLLELNNSIFNLTNKRTAAIETFIASETQTTIELAKINTERQELLKKLTQKGLSQ